jgi:4-hydroxythreonine-4-phosphate dehydrogenase
MPADSVILITTGEPAGIGPDICIALARRSLPGRAVFVGAANVLEERATRLGTRVGIRSIPDASAAAPHAPGVMSLIDIPVAACVQAGKLDVANAPHVLAALDRAAALCSSGAAAALVTAPVQKSLLNEAGIPFSGHTEYLAERTGAAMPVMMLVSDALRVALVTTHLPLADVARHIDAARLEHVLRVLERDLRERFRIARPRIRVLGLNPHAGENGVLGREELDIIGPVVARLAGEGLALLGPSPADTAFTGTALAEADAVLAMYHDQGLPVIKALAFGSVVNVTLGLPIIRTSVDHGTALTLAGTGRAKADSLAAAYMFAARLAGVSDE